MHAHCCNFTGLCFQEDVPTELCEKEKEIAMAQAEGKPPQAIEKIIQGKLEKYFSTVCLIEQPFVKDPESSIRELVASVAKDLSTELSIKEFAFSSRRRRLGLTFSKLIV